MRRNESRRKLWPVHIRPAAGVPAGRRIAVPGRAVRSNARAAFAGSPGYVRRAFGAAPRFLVALCLLYLSLLAAALVTPAAVAQAHGKELRATLSAGGPVAAGQPLTRRYHATVTYADGDPAPAQAVWLSAKRVGSDQAVPPQRLAAGDAAGIYAGTITLPQYGRWQLSLRVETGAEGSAEGAATLEEEVLPLAPAAAGAPGGVQPAATASIVIGFGLRDVLNLLALGLHLAGTVLWLGAVAAVFGAAHLARRGILEPLAVAARWFGAAAGGGLLLLAASGAYNAVYNTPSRAPGLLEPALIARLPYGSVYLALFAAKLGFTVAIVALSAWMALILRRVARDATTAQPAQRLSDRALTLPAAEVEYRRASEVAAVTPKAAVAVAVVDNGESVPLDSFAGRGPTPRTPARPRPAPSSAWLGETWPERNGRSGAHATVGPHGHGPDGLVSLGAPGPEAPTTAAAVTLRRLAAACLLSGLATLCTVVALDYLHLLSHLGALLP